MGLFLVEIREFMCTYLNVKAVINVFASTLHI